MRAVRVRRGFSQEALAHDTDMSSRYLGGIERGEMNPSAEQLLRLGLALGVQPGALLPKVDLTSGQPL